MGADFTGIDCWPSPLICLWALTQCCVNALGLHVISNESLPCSEIRYDRCMTTRHKLYIRRQQAQTADRSQCS